MFPTTLTSGTRHPNDTSLSIKDVRIRALFALAFKGRNQGMSLADLEDVDALFDQEKFVVENGELVGTTATINEDEITQTTGKPLEGYSPLIGAND